MIAYVLFATLFAVSNPPEPIGARSVPHAGSTCRFGDLTSAAIGYPLPGGGGRDIPGPHGNEAKQIYRVFYAYRANGHQETGFAGWLYVAFNERYAFSAAGIATRQNPLPLWMLDVTPNNRSSLNPNHLPVRSWIRNLSMRSGADTNHTISAVVRGEPTGTAVSVCFSRDWNGKSE